MHRLSIGVPIAGGLSWVANGVYGRLDWCGRCGAIREGFYSEKPNPNYVGWPIRWGRWRKPDARS